VNNLKLFVWHEALTDYTPGVMFALASSVDEARRMLLSECSYLPDYDLEKEPAVYETPVGFAVWGGG
jgi:hypothetical protein